MPFIADLHIHSKYSRATSRSLDIETLYRHALLKGIGLLGTGDFTHPAWMAEIEEKLIPSGDGLFTLRPDLISAASGDLPASVSGELHYMLSSEISCIYKKNGATRKNHNLVFFPTITAAKAFNKKLATLGNIASDGRPILGLDARDLLEIVLTTDEKGVLIPAHIWTPWFSLFGSKSGFDSITACFGDLTPHIFAGETGLSSDPAMNRRVSMLDGLTLISNSDAHSPAKLGREANLFDTERSYDAIFHALKTPGNPGFKGTLEFFPEEGKYHMDGHRKCGICLEPEASVQLGDICPVCGKPLTLGVLHRVLELADRSQEAADTLSPHYPGFESMIPLQEILSEILSVGPASKRVQGQLSTLIQKLGPELTILRDLTRAEIDTAGVPLLGEAIMRMRRAEVIREGGYDGEYGVVKIFSEADKSELPGQSLLFPVPKQMPGLPKIKKPAPPPLKKSKKIEEPPLVKGLNTQQREAILAPSGPLLIVAGPGTGKTHTLTRRIAHLIKEGVAASSILAITFTHRAAGEMAERLGELMEESPPKACTFHALALELLSKKKNQSLAMVDDAARKRLMKEAITLSLGPDDQKKMRVGTLARFIEAAKQQLLTPCSEHLPLEGDGSTLFRRCYGAYETLLSENGLMDFEGILLHLVDTLEHDTDFYTEVRQRFTHIFIDEYQDLNHAQYRLIQLLAPPGQAICAIGDPNQAIYGFRGSSSAYFHRFAQEYPDATHITLTQNYRSSKTILAASGSLLGDPGRVVSDIDGVEHITITACASAEEEAVTIGKQIETLVGGLGFHSMDFGTIKGETADYSFGDIAILSRTHSQGVEIATRLTGAGIPCALTAKTGPFDHPLMRRFLAALRLLLGCGSLLDLEEAAPLFTKTAPSFPLSPPRSDEGDVLQPKDLIADPTRLPESWCGNHKAMQTLLQTLLALTQGIRGDTARDHIHYLLGALPDMGQSRETDAAFEDAVTDLIHRAEAFGPVGTTARFLAEIALSRGQDTLSHAVERVNILTLHASKGLEFPVVFISGCETGLLPFEPMGKEPSDPEEERRLFYVAMTRAKERLILTHTAKRLRFGVPVPCAPSPYLAQIHAFLKETQRRRPAPQKEETKGPIQMSLF